MQELSFITGLITGMLIIQIFFHRFHEALPDDEAPRIIRSAKENHVLRNTGKPRACVARDNPDDGPLWLGPLGARRPPDHIVDASAFRACRPFDLRYGFAPAGRLQVTSGILGKLVLPCRNQGHSKHLRDDRFRNRQAPGSRLRVPTKASDSAAHCGTKLAGVERA
jgi:hypothetical protein